MQFKFISEIFQDTDGGASMKRAAFAVFCLFFVVMSGLVVLHGISTDVVGFANATLDKTQDIIKWLGGFILADKTPDALRALKGDAQNRTVSTVVKETVDPPVTGG